MDRDERSDGESRGKTRTPFVPSESWIEAFDAQCTEPTLKALRRFAAYCARLLGRNAPSDYAEDLVQSALADTARGVLRWDPAHGDLGTYLGVVIRMRARRDRVRAVRYEHLSIHDPDDESSGITAAVEAALAVNASVRGIEDAKSNARLAQLRALVGDDPLAHRFLDAIEQDAETREDIMQLAGLTHADYHNTRRRLARHVAQLKPRRGTSAKED